jgi:hypothetical protein
MTKLRGTPLAFANCAESVYPCASIRCAQSRKRVKVDLHATLDPAFDRPRKNKKKIKKKSPIKCK